LLAVRKGLEEISMEVLDEGVDRATLGVLSRATLISAEERQVVAYHEAGHALVAAVLPGADLPHRLTIQPRGGTLGHCSMADTHDRVTWSRSRLVAHMASLLGGWVAEKVVFDEVGSGASSDLERASTIARRMVRDWGMSDTVGPMSFPTTDTGWGPVRYSEQESVTIYVETRTLVGEARKLANDVLVSRRSTLDVLASALLERETLSRGEILAMVDAPQGTAAHGNGTSDSAIVTSTQGGVLDLPGGRRGRYGI
ncbi:MAG: ATP-dependent metallopeptidase FtsH/Yme1/Tma family protein, partial [Acidimicrobiales bacterium]